MVRRMPSGAQKVVGLFAGLCAVRLFRLLYLALAFLSFTCFTAELPFLSMGSYALVLLGFVIVLSRLLSGKMLLSDMGSKLLLGFLASFVISATLVVRYGVIENVQGFVWLTLEFFVLYEGSTYDGKDKAYREMRLFAAVFVAVTFAYAVVSLVMALVGFGYGGSFVSDLPNTGGIYQNRLFGLYSDPNYGGVCGIVSILLSFYVFRPRAHKLHLCLIVVNALVQVAYLSLTASRTAIVSGCVAVIVVAVYVIYAYGSNRNYSKLKIGALSALISLVGLFAFVGSTVAFVSLYEQAEPHVLRFLGGAASPLELIFEDGYESRVREVLGELSPAEGEEATGIGAALDEPSSSSGQGRTVELGALARNENEDATTGRLGIWKSAVRVWIAEPFFGVSHRNLIEYAEDNLPDEYISIEHISTMHNVFLDVLAAQGIVGFVLFAGFLLTRAKACMTYAARGARGFLFSGDRKSFLLVAVVAAILASAMFYSEVIYINTVSSVVFWVVLGHLSFLAREGDR